MQKEELVSELCPIDCVYRSYIEGGNIPICFYIAIAEEPRRCKISECDKYKPGKPIKPRIDREYILFWEREVYNDDGDVDIIW